MNERIKELYTQVCQDQNLPFTIEHNSAYMLDNFANKFAELIVRECIDVIGEDNYTMLTGKAYCTELKRHFWS